MCSQQSDHPAPALLGVAETRRLCIALIRDEQDRLLREGRLDRSQAIDARLSQAGAPAPDDLVIDEDTLGFDSLSLLDLIMGLTRFFGLAASGVEDYLLVQRRLGDWAEITARHFEIVGDAAEITFSTSGSTGIAKTITQPRTALEAEVAANAAVLFPDRPGGGRVLSTVSPVHIYGFLWSCLLPRRMGLDTRDLHAAAPTAVLRAAAPGDIVLGTPFTWANLARLGRPLPAGVVGVTAGGPSTGETWAAARTLGLARLIDIYGSTETGGIGTRTAEGEDFALMRHIEAPDGGLVRSDGQAVEIQDRLEWTGARRFRVLGRKDGVVQVAGTNVSPDEVRRVLLQDPKVRDAAIRLDGGRLKAFVVPASATADTDELEQALRARVARTLPAPARPDRFAFGPELPRTATGKLADWPAADFDQAMQTET